MAPEPMCNHGGALPPARRRPGAVWKDSVSQDQHTDLVHVGLFLFPANADHTKTCWESVSIFRSQHTDV